MCSESAWLLVGGSDKKHAAGSVARKVLSNVAKGKQLGLFLHKRLAC